MEPKRGAARPEKGGGRRESKSRGSSVYLFASLAALSLLLALVCELKIANLATAARLKGLIYNKDGKFIFRPPRSSQIGRAHV